MSDALTGKRDALNAGESGPLYWPCKSIYERAPVATGDVFILKNCRIDIQSVTRESERNNTGRRYFWKAEIKRTTIATSDRVQILRPKSGYTSSPKQALAADDSHLDATVKGEDFNAHPPEPESVPPTALQEFTGKARADQRFAREAEDAEFRRLPVEQRIARLKEIAEGEPRLERNLTRIEEAVTAAEKKAKRLAA